MFWKDLKKKTKTTNLRANRHRDAELVVRTFALSCWCFWSSGKLMPKIYSYSKKLHTLLAHFPHFTSAVIDWIHSCNCARWRIASESRKSKKNLTKKKSQTNVWWEWKQISNSQFPPTRREDKLSPVWQICVIYKPLIIFNGNICPFVRLSVAPPPANLKRCGPLRPLKLLVLIDSSLSSAQKLRLWSVWAVQRPLRLSASEEEAMPRINGWTAVIIMTLRWHEELIDGRPEASGLSQCLKAQAVCLGGFVQGR